MQIHQLIQGSDEWHQFRLTHNGASEAAAMLGLSKKVKRNELLRMKATGSAKEFSAWVQENILDHGHKVEALARPHAEAFIGEELYPVTCSRGKESASCDGLTIAENIAWEHKQWNEALAASVAAGVLPEEHMPQCQQIMLVTEVEKVVFTVSDGTPEKMVHMTVLPDTGWFKRILDGWQQFDIDAEAYEHVEVLPAAVAAPVKDLPALSIRVDGALTLNHNLVLFGEQLQSFIADINVKPEDDQAFADAEAAIKVMERAEEALGAAEASALGQISTVDDMVRTVATYKELARKTRLMLQKVVTARKETIRVEIQQDASGKAVSHIAALNTRLGKPYMPVVTTDFAGAMKGKKTVSSLRDAADTELARFKIAANAIADKIQINLGTLRDLAGAHAFLFADAAQIVLKESDDLTALVKLRIADHEKEEAAKAEALRAKIAEEERVKAVAAEQARVQLAEVARLAEEHEAAERQKAVEAAQQVTKPVEVVAQPQVAEQTATTSAPAAAIQMRPAPAASTPIRQPEGQPTLRLGQINERIAPLAISADGLRSLGFEPAGRDKSAILFHESQFPLICAALVKHIESVLLKQAA